MPKRQRNGGRRSGVSDDLLDAEPAAEMDLHGLSADEARRKLLNDLPAYRARYSGCVVHIITGRGRNSANGPVLKPLVRELLQGPLAGHIRDHTQDLDEGGYLVRLR